MLRLLPWTIQILLAAVVGIASYYDIRYRRIPTGSRYPA